MLCSSRQLCISTTHFPLFPFSTQVFKAEEIASGGRSYHHKCATCFACEKQLTFNTVCAGDDREIYCKSCYGRKFAPAGFRGAGASGWVDQESSNVLRHSYQAF